MSEPLYSEADLALLADLGRATRAVDMEACLIGAGAIQLGPDKQWNMRLARRTKDWDFAVRVDSWEKYEELVASLLSERGGFSRVSEPHRFRHHRGGLLDVVPYGDLEHPPGRIEWPDGIVMNTAGFSVLDQHHNLLQIESLELWTASRPAVVGLKLLAYLDRRPGILRDIRDVYALIQGAETCVPEDRVESEGLKRLTSGAITYGEIGAYLLGRDVGTVFSHGELAPVIAVLDTLHQPENHAVGDVLAQENPPETSRERVIERLAAFRMGVQDA